MGFALELRDARRRRARVLRSQHPGWRISYGRRGWLARSGGAEVTASHAALLGVRIALTEEESRGRG